MRKILIIAIAAAGIAQPLVTRDSVREKHAEFWRLSYLQLQIAVTLQDLRRQIPAEAKMVGCEIGDDMERLQCPTEPKK